MRKLLALLLALSVAAAIAGCGREDTASDETTSGVETASGGTTAAQAATPSLGKVDGNTYTSDYLGIGCTLDDGWVFYSAEQLQTLPEGLQDNKDAWDELDTGTQVFDMKAESSEELAAVNIVLTKSSAQERVAYALLSEQDLMDSLLEQKDTLISSYTEAGFTVDSVEAATVTFLGKERLALRTVASLEGVPYYVLQVFDYSLGQFSMTLTASCFMEDITEDLIAEFYAL